MFSKILRVFLVSTLVLGTHALSRRTVVDITTCDDVGSAAKSDGDFYIEIGDYDLFSYDATTRHKIDNTLHDDHEIGFTIPYLFNHDLHRDDENQHTLVAETSDGWCVSGVRIQKFNSLTSKESYHDVKFWLDSPCTAAYYNGVPCFEEVTLYSDVFI